MHRVERTSIPIRTLVLVTVLLIALALALSAFAADDAESAAAQEAEPKQEAQPDFTPGAVFGMSNDRDGNEVVAFNRGADGLLEPAGTFETGGTGSGTIEDSSNGLVLANLSGESSPNNLQGTPRFLLATNAGSNDVSVFRVEPDGLELVDVEPSNGDHPTSVTVSKGVVYVMNSGGFMCSGTTSVEPNITGFKLDAQGELTPIPGSTRPLTGQNASGCTQVSFNPRGDTVIVTEQQADVISTYTVNKDGTLDGPVANQSTGNGPFGFAFTQRGQLVTTENFGAAPGQGGAASYDVEKDGTLTPLSPTVRNGQSDTCWAVITDDGKFAFITNFQSGTISSYRVLPDGNLVLINGAEEFIGEGAADQALSVDSKYLYARNSNQNTISVFRVENDGTLTRIQDVSSGSPSGGALGIAAK